MSSQHRVSHAHLDIFRWLALWFLAGMAITYFANRAGGQESLLGHAGLQPLPPGMTDGAKPIPMPNVDTPDTFRYPLDRRFTEDRTTDGLWQAIALHSQGRHQEAAAAWQELRMLPASETWKQVAIGFAYRQAARPERARDAMAAAQAAQPTNPVAQFLLAEWDRGELDPTPLRYDPGPQQRFRMASLRGDLRDDRNRDGTFLPHFDFSAARKVEARYREVLRWAPACDIDQPLRVSARYAVQLVSLQDQPEVRPPTVRDLLRALGAEDYLARSHRALAELLLHRGSLAEAETALDTAAAEGVRVGAQYYRLAEAYEAAGEKARAADCYAKARQWSEPFGYPDT